MDEPNNGNVGSSSDRSFLDLANGFLGLATGVAGAVRGSAGNGTEPTVRAPQATAPQSPNNNTILYIVLGVIGLIAVALLARK